MSTDRAELAERRRLRDDLRSRGIPIPVQLMEQEAIAAGGGGGGSGGFGGGTAANGREKILVNMWSCVRDGCRRWNWPGRIQCSSCGWAKTSAVRRRIEGWEAARLPRWAQEEAAPLPPGRPPARAGGSPQRIPGLGNGPSGGRGGRGVGAVGDRAELPPRGLDPRRSAPGTLDGGGEAAGGERRRSEGGDRRGVDGSDGDWVAVVRGNGSRRGGQRGARGVTDGGGVPGVAGSGGGGDSQQQKHQQQVRQPSVQRADEAHAGGGATGAVEGEGGGEGDRDEDGRNAPQPRDLPPMRLVDIPTRPRMAIARSVEAATEKVGRLQEQGVGEAKLHRARETKDRLVKELRAAGGPTEKALSFSIKGEDDRIERAERALRRAIEDKEKKEARVAALQAELVEDEEGIARHRQRLQAAREYREHLATQKLIEVSDRTLQHLRTLAAAVSPQDQQQAQAQAWALRAVQLGAWKDEVDLAGGDTDSGEEEGGGMAEAESEGAATDRTRLDLAHEGTQAEASGESEELRRGLSEARGRLEAVQREQSEALGRVTGPLGGGNKRDSAGECKGGDQEGDVDMVPPLTALQVSSMFAERLREAEGQVRHYEILLAKEEVLPPEAGGGERAMAPRQPPPAHDLAGSRQAFDRGRAEEQAGLAGGQSSNQGGMRGRPHRRPGYESWVTAEERDEAAADAESRHLQREKERHQLLQRPRTASREVGPGRCRWSVGTGKAAAGRQRSVGPRVAAGAEGWAEVERAFRMQQRAGDDLESRVRDNLQVAEQERMQRQQESERKETAMAKAVVAARGIESRLAGGPGEVGPRGAAPPGPGEGDGQVVPTFGPTGQRLDEQQQLLRVAAAGAAADRAGVVARPPSVPRRKTRWGDDSEVEEDGARERSQRGARSLRSARGAMEE